MQVVQAEPAPYVDSDVVHTHIPASMFKCLQKLDSPGQRKVQAVL